MATRTSATQFRAQLFEMLSEVQKGATVLIERNGRVVARLVPAHESETEGHWRAAIHEKPVYLVERTEAFAPMEDLFDVE